MPSSPKRVSTISRRNVCRSPVSSESENENIAGNMSNLTFSDCSPESPMYLSPRKNSRKKIKNKKWSLKKKIEHLSEEMMGFLYEVLDEKNQAEMRLKFGFGQGCIVEIPQEPLQKDCLDELGFECSRGIFYQIANAKAEKIHSILTDILPNCYGRSIAKSDVVVEPFSSVYFSPVCSKKDEHFSLTCSHHVQTPITLLTPDHYEFGKSFGENDHLNKADGNKHLSIEVDELDVLEANKETLAIKRGVQFVEEFAEEDIFEQEKLSFLDNDIKISSRKSMVISQNKRSRNRARRLSRIVTSSRRNTVLGKLQELDIPSHHHSNTRNKGAYSLLLIKAAPILLRSGYISVQDIMLNGRFVSVSWRKLSISASAWLTADYKRQPLLHHYEEFHLKFPWGKYLSDGAYKEVFQVWCRDTQQYEAISVMSISSIEDTGNEAIICQELQHSILLSELVETNICSNFLQIFDTFLMNFSPSKSVWGEKSNKTPLGPTFDHRRLALENLKPDSAKQPYQYIRMELCDGGDLEEFIRNQDTLILPLYNAVLPFLFQMIYSLHTAQGTYELRHYDVKLLNFFLKRIVKKTSFTVRTMSYSVSGRKFIFKFPEEYAFVVKLADYGTADSLESSLEAPIGISQFTTLENTPIDFFLLGDLALQNYAIDTFGLGLSMLHLFTGIAPYEELLADVLCPPSLFKALKAIWVEKPSKKSREFSVLASVLKDDEENILYHTFYRFLVLFGLPEEGEFECKQYKKVWKTITTQLNGAPLDNRKTRVSRRTSTSNKIKNSPACQYETDCITYSLQNGQHPSIINGRDRLKEIPSALEILLQMVAFNPKKRPSMKNILFSPMFEAFESSNMTEFSCDISHHQYN